MHTKAPAEREVLDEVMAAHDEVVAIRKADGFLAEPGRFRHYEKAQQRLSVDLDRLYATIKHYSKLTGDTPCRTACGSSSGWRIGCWWPAATSSAQPA
ncbi:hypothetical protein [Microvirga sp. VF16]|uniref:hypothetical protein n=1 Tax=Microvirga sp. VF16 TaxID=2807101 RepID=UPI00193E7C14|nr:hypothetical protein [Microvirga sp. VF16]QRM35202.1 hypothetical protein JO965_40165 [Microvirga sp. VF16]